jgi:hypothetical protein
MTNENVGNGFGDVFVDFIDPDYFYGGVVSGFDVAQR